MELVNLLDLKVLQQGGKMDGGDEDEEEGAEEKGVEKGQREQASRDDLYGAYFYSTVAECNVLTFDLLHCFFRCVVCYSEVERDAREGRQSEK